MGIKKFSVKEIEAIIKNNCYEYKIEDKKSWGDCSVSYTKTINPGELLSNLRKIAAEKKFEGEIKLTGNLLHYGQKNLNGRIYTKEVVENIVKQFEKREEAMFGELGYPDTFDVALANVSHRIEEIHLDEDKKALVGTIKILDTPKGRIVKDLLKNRVGISCRPRGAGKINENDEIEDFKLYSFDLISGSDAFENIAPNDSLNFLTEPDTD